MSDWPRRYWIDPDGNIHRHDTEDMESNERRAVLVYPADQAPEPVAWWNGLRDPREWSVSLEEDSQYDIPLIDTFNPVTESAIRASERERISKMCDHYFYADSLKQAILELSDDA